MIEPLELALRSLEIENELLPGGDLAPRPGKEPTLLAAYRLPDQERVFFGCDVPAGLRRRLLDLGFERLLGEPVWGCTLLETFTHPVSAFEGMGCVFERVAGPAGYPEAVRMADAWVVRAGGQAVCRAWTQDESQRAAELAVETLPAFRGRGYARQAALAWADEILGQGRIAFYSYKVTNTASAALARKLGVTPYARFTVYAGESGTTGG